MNKDSLQEIALKLLDSTDIQLNGNRPWDIQVHNPDFYSRVLKGGSLAFGESYMDGWWDCESIDQLFMRISESNLEDKIKTNFRLLSRLALSKFINFQSKNRAFQVGEAHYDLGNDLYQKMLDSRMNYSCAYWKNANNLDAAQLNKLDLTCKKLYLSPGMHLLDIGCGFGALAVHAAKYYDVNVVGVTISKQQYEYAQQQCKGLPIKIFLKDYRDIEGQFDRVVSIGMFEHVGPLNYAVYMKKAYDSLKEHGLFLLHTIGSTSINYQADPWINKYIFPNSVLPSIPQIANAFQNLFIMEDWHNFGADYDKTLMAWQANFRQHWDELKTQYDERFYRMWNYYLGSCAGYFRARQTQLWQIVLSKGGVKGGYESVR